MKHELFKFALGRQRCDCQAVRHALVNNCLSCGRVVCVQEGSGPCFFCGEIVRMKILNKKITQLRFACKKFLCKVKACMQFNLMCR